MYQAGQLSWLDVQPDIMMQPTGQVLGLDIQPHLLIVAILDAT
jgi:hypothetical protein